MNKAFVTSLDLQWLKPPLPQNVVQAFRPDEFRNVVQVFRPAISRPEGLHYETCQDRQT